MRPVQLRHLKALGEDAALYLVHKLRRTSYDAYYARRMDRVVRRNPNWGLNLDKTFQLRYLVDHGLEPSSTMLDYGCGALAAGLLFVDYLDHGNYVGVDISSGVLEEGRRRLELRGLAHKDARLHLLQEGSLACLGDATFDVVWAQSVFTHMPPDAIRHTMRGLRDHMHAKSVIYASFARVDDHPGQRRFKDWYYEESHFRRLADELGFQLTVADDWVHPDDVAGRDSLARFTIGSVEHEPR